MSWVTTTSMIKAASARGLRPRWDDVRICTGRTPLSSTVERPGKIPASTETALAAACRLNEMKPEVSAHMEKVADDRTLQFWGIGSRDLGNVPKAALEHPR